MHCPPWSSMVKGSVTSRPRPVSRLSGASCLPIPSRDTRSSTMRADCGSRRPKGSGAWRPGTPSASRGAMGCRPITCGSYTRIATGRCGSARTAGLGALPRRQVRDTRPGPWTDRGRGSPRCSKTMTGICGSPATPGSSASRARGQPVPRWPSRSSRRGRLRARRRLRNPEGTGFPGHRSRDGRLWFGTFDGIAVVDPRLARGHAEAGRPP